MKFTPEQKRTLRSEGIDSFLDGFRSGCSTVGFVGCAVLFLALSMCSNKPVNHNQIQNVNPKLVQKGNIKLPVQKKQHEK